ncbi:hypothetical protein EV192_106371 [Actinocrispum wychmicini]|uniref:DinB family protein n=1 Tax=Actinocrispum wychmicini TaxID=1213861 RepID=A0A4R2JIR4_9PSEU|nr:hypothetical protein EV192_106371 [Actinocrispum wychmicini]
MCGSERPNNERGTLLELVQHIIIYHTMGHFVALNQLLSEAPSFRWMAGCEGRERDWFLEAVRRAEIQHQDVANREYLFTALTADDAAEEMGMHSDERVTCRNCRNWADHTH